MNKKTYTSTLRLEASAPWLEPLAAWAQDLATDGPLMQAIMRRMLVWGLFPRIYARFLAGVSKAQKVRFQQASKLSTLGANDMIRKRVAYQKAVAAQQKAYERKNFSEVEAAQERLDRIIDEIQGASSKRNQDNATSSARAISLAAIGAGLFRQRQARVIQLITSDPVVMQSASGLVAAAGPLNQLEQIKTPSATNALVERQSRSPHNIFWRHLEYGTGEDRKNDPQGNPIRDTKYQKVELSEAEEAFQAKGGEIPSWYFGRLGMFGSEPMNFLSDRSLKAYADYREALMEELDAAIKASLPTWEGGPAPNKPGWIITQKRTL